MVFSFTNGAWIQTKYGGKECFPFTNRAWVQINYKGKGVVKIKYKKKQAMKSQEECLTEK